MTANHLFIAALILGFSYLIHKQMSKCEFLLFVWKFPNGKRHFLGKYKTPGDAKQALEDYEFANPIYDYTIKPVMYRRVPQVFGAEKLALKYNAFLAEKEQNKKNREEYFAGKMLKVKKVAYKSV